jgi:hypothetical protein
MNIELIAGIATVVITILGALGVVSKAKGRLAKAAVAAKEAADVITKANEILDDNKITSAEIVEFQKELVEARDALKAVFAKEIPE